MGRIVAAGNIVDASPVTGFSVKPSHAIEHTGVRFLAIGIDGLRVDPARLFARLRSTSTASLCLWKRQALKVYVCVTKLSFPVFIEH